MLITKPLIHYFFPLLEHDKPSQADLSTYVTPSVADNWRVLGQLLLSNDLVEKRWLEIIEADYPGSVVNCCNRMFTTWLESDTNASWKKLIEALQSRGIQLNNIAEDIQKMLLKGNKAMIINEIIAIKKIYQHNS